MERNGMIEEAMRILARVRDGEDGVEALDDVAKLVADAKRAQPDGQKLTLSQLRRAHGERRIAEAEEFVESRGRLLRMSESLLGDATRSSGIGMTRSERKDLAQAEQVLEELKRLYREGTAEDPVFLPLGARVRLKRKQVEDPVNGKHMFPLRKGSAGVVTMNDPDRDYPVRVTFDRPVKLADGEVLEPNVEQPGGHYVDAADLEVVSLAETLDGETYEHVSVAFDTHEYVWGPADDCIDRWLVLRDGEGRIWSLARNDYGDGTDVIHQFHDKLPDRMESIDENAASGPKP